MTRKIIKYISAAILVLVIAFNSVYFKKLSDFKAAATKQFNPATYARTYYDTQLKSAAAQAPDADQLLTSLKNTPAKTFKTYAHALDIGNIRFFMIKGHGTITAIDENDATILTKGKQTFKIATEYVFGNALRDAPGLIDINKFNNTMDLNNIAAEVDKIVRTEVLPPFKTKAKVGDQVNFSGAFELNQEHINLDKVEVMPVTLQITKS